MLTLAFMLVLALGLILGCELPEGASVVALLVCLFIDSIICMAIIFT